MRTLQSDRHENLFTSMNFDFRVRRMICTTKWIERLNKSFRKILNMRNAVPNAKVAITLIVPVTM